MKPIVIPSAKKSEQPRVEVPRGRAVLPVKSVAARPLARRI